MDCSRKEDGDHRARQVPHSAFRRYSHTTGVPSERLDSLQSDRRSFVTKSSKTSIAVKCRRPSDISNPVTSTRGRQMAGPPTTHWSITAKNEREGKTLAIDVQRNHHNTHSIFTILKHRLATLSSKHMKFQSETRCSKPVTRWHSVSRKRAELRPLSSALRSED